ncbi:MAG: AsmA family protein [Caldimonas sp.]
MKAPWIRRTVFGLGALLLLVIVAAAVLVATFDANRYKSLAIDWMKTERQRTLAIDGPIELSLLPRLAIKVSRVRLSEAGSDRAFLAVDEAALDVAVLPLLSRKLVIDRIRARGVEASYLRDAQGRRNIDDLVASGTNGAGPASEPSGGRPLRFDISAIRLDDLRLHLRDDKLDLAGDLAVATLSTGRLAQATPSPVTLRASAALTRPQPATLAVDGGFTVVLDLDRNAVSLSALAIALEVGTEATTASLEAKGEIAWDGRALQAGPLHVTVKKAVFGAGTLDPSTIDLARAAYSPDDERVELQALRLALSGRQGTQRVALELAWPELAVAGERLSGSPVSGRLELSGPATLSGTFRSAAPGGSFAALRLDGVAMTMKGAVGARQVSGDVEADVVLQGRQRAASIEKLAVHASLAQPGLPPLALAANGSAEVEAGAKAVRWSLAGALNTNRFDSRGRASSAGRVPRLEVEARFDNLDLNALLGSGTSGSGAPAAPPTPADTPVQLDVLEAVDGNFLIDAGALAFRQYRVADAHVDATLADGVLRIKRLTGGAWSGRFDGSGRADARKKQIAVRLDADGVDIDALLQNVTGKNLLEGTGHVVADVATSGASIGALRSHLAGSAAMQIRNGAIKGINLARVFRQAKAALVLRQDAVSAAGNEKTDFTELSASARIADGVARSDDLSVKSPFLRVGGSGSFDVGRGRIDYIARATVTDTAAGQGGAELRALRGVTIPVALTGPFDAIDWQIQWSKVAADAIRNQLKDKLLDQLGGRLGEPAAGDEKAKGRPKDAVRGVLKGLFR